MHEEAHEDRVSTVELFFDLVFVFTITQLTHLVDHAHDVVGFALPLLALTVIWWHYAGYVWLTNAAGSARGMRLVLIAAMAGFLVMAVSIPELGGSGGLAFGLAYLFVVVLHLAAFVIQGGRAALRAVAGLAPINLGAAAFVVAAGILDAPWDWALFAGAIAMFAFSTLSRREAGFSVRSTHFAERHGLVMIIALGETIISIGTGAGSADIHAWTLAAIVVALVVIAATWWSYFDRDDERGEHALGHAPAAKQSRLALVGYWYTHLVMIVGVVLLASGIKVVVSDPLVRAPGAAWLVASGAAVYVVGGILFRRAMRIPHVGARGLGAMGALAAGALGTLAPAIVVLATVATVLVALIVAERATGAA